MHPHTGHPVVTAAQNPLRMRAVFVSDVGRKRAKNQDNGLARAAQGLCLVADGMGGHKGGETASQIVVDTFEQTYSSIQGQLLARAQATLEEAHRRIFELSQQQPALQGMGTTTTCFAFDPEPESGQAVVLHVGDSRCYLLQAQDIWQVTRDHSLVQEKVRAGLIKREQARHDAMKNVITRSVGFEAQLQLDTYWVPTHRGDWYLLCSDGLTGQIEDREILSISQSYRSANPEAPDLEGCAREMIALANARGGDDNISVGIVQLS